MQIINASYINYTAKKFFNLKKLYNLQKIVIRNILNACGLIETQEDIIRRQLVILPTGYGKSICYMLPSLIIENGLSLAVYPLHSLIEDQKQRLRKAGIIFYELTGRLNYQEKINELKRIRNTKQGFILTNPETLTNKTVSQEITKIDIKHIIIDEAHIIKQWGSSFRPAYLEMIKTLNRIQPAIISAFTATASAENIDFIKQYLFNNEDFTLIEKCPDRPNIHYSAFHSISKNHELKNILNNKETEYPVLIFCRQRIRTEILSRELRTHLQSDSVYFYHSGLSKGEKHLIEKWFMNSRSGILVSTCAYGMGVDKPDIRTVIHYSPPGSIEEYLQESGRAGRDKEKASAIILYNEIDLPGINKSLISEQMKNYLTSNDCRRFKLLEAMGHNEIIKCNNCDSCLNKTEIKTSILNNILMIIKENNRKLTKSELLYLLKGKPSPIIYKKLLYINNYFGFLKDWDINDIETIIDYLLENKFIKTPKKGIYKYKIILNKAEI